MAGRPLRFLALTAAGWMAMRVVALWPSMDGDTTLIDVVAPPALAMTDAPVAIRTAPPVARANAAESLPVRHPQIPLARKSSATPSVSAPPVLDHITLALDAPSPVTAPVIDRRLPGIAPPLGPTPPSSTSRLSGSAWLIARGGSNRSLLGGQLGASQAGVRLLYALGDARRLFLTARVATPLPGRGREAAMGVEWRPARSPVRFVAEQRVALSGGRGGPSVLAIGGIGPTRVVADVDLEAYGQAGGIVRDRLEGFADGAARIARPMARIGPARLDLGMGAWGGIQRDAGRLDIGPTIGLSVPIARRTIRLTIDWRERIAGSARPDSGPALSLGIDF